MGKTIIFDYDGCIVPCGCPYQFNASPAWARKLSNIVRLDDTCVVLCSGRSIESLEKAAADLKSYGINVSSIIAEGGSIIKNKILEKTEIVVKSDQLKLLKNLKNLFKEFSTGNNFIIQEEKQVALSIFQSEENISKEQLYAKFLEIINYLTFSGIIKDSDLEKIQVYQTPEGIDVYPACTVKEKAVKRFLMQNSFEDTIIGVGDGKNDLKWLKILKNDFGGVVVAPENAVEEIKKLASFVGKGEHLIGVVNALESLYEAYEEDDEIKEDQKKKNTLNVSFA